MCLAGSSAMAGGLFTNTNQNPIFFRQPAQNAVIGVQGTYYDPAGLALMEEGFHFGIGNQVAIQERRITSTYKPFAYNVSRPGQETVEYKGKTVSPVIPTLDLSYNRNSWAASFHFGVLSGGGACEFGEGLGSFESQLSLPVLSSAGALKGYMADINFTGKSFGFAGQFNFSYRLIDESDMKLAVAAGLRLNYLMNNYSGGIFDYSLVNAAGMALPASVATMDQAANNMEVKCIQKGFALNPILSAHYSISKFDIAARYEFNTAVTLKNETETNTTGLAQFENGVESRSDIPALLAVGLNYNILPTFRASVGYHLFFDKNATYGNDRQELLDGNTWEGLAGLEWDACSRLTVSVGSQFTVTSLGEYNNDMSFSMDAWCLGGGFRYHINDRIAIDLSAFDTFYQGSTKEYANYGPTLAAQPGKDEFMRTSLSFGLGLTCDF